MVYRGINVWAVLVAAIAICMLGFIIYGVVFSGDAWIAMSGFTKDQIESVGATRMPYGAIMPLVTAICLAVIFKIANITNVSDGVRMAFVVALGSALMARLYGWVYGVTGLDILMVDWAHLMAGHLVAGAIIAGWPAKKTAAQAG
jgi:hypothetical protein